MTSTAPRTGLIAAAALALQGGCAGRFQFNRDMPSRMNGDVASDSQPMAPRELPMFAARQNGLRIDWNELLAAAHWADVVIIGEEHDDPLGHDVQLAVVEDLLRHAPAGSIALSMEMLERDDQPIIDDYLAGLIETDEFIEQTDSGHWPDWTESYQPIIDAAKGAGSPIIAANAPRRYVRLARTEGYDYLRDLTAAQRALFALPSRRPSDQYRARFFEVMSSPDVDEPPKPQDAATTPARDGTVDAPAAEVAVAATQAAAHRHAVDVAGIEAGFRSQLVWDATMGQSIARALRQPGVDKVVHLAGHFHSDFDGGTVQMLRASSSPLDPPRILTISMNRRAIESASLAAEDIDRADIVVCTGKRPPEEDAAEAEN